MSKLNYTITYFFQFLAFCQAVAQDTCTLNGTIANVTEGKLIMGYHYPVDHYVRDTLQITSGTFHHKIVLQGRVNAQLWLMGAPTNVTEVNELDLILHEGTIDIYLTKNHFDGRTMVPFQPQEPVFELAKAIKPLQQQLWQLRHWVDSAEVCLDSSSVEPNRQMAMVVSYLKNRVEQTSNTLVAAVLNFIRQQPETPYAAQQLRFMLDQIPREEAQTLYDALSPAAKQSHAGVQVGRYLTAWPGHQAKSFTGRDAVGRPISLDSMVQHGYVLLDFWASWCAPCRADIPGLLALQKKYGPKGFEVIAISRDDKAVSAWQKAIAQDGTPHWCHLNENAFEKGAINLEYGVGAIPVKILIDKKGEIVYRSNGSGLSGLQAALEEAFGY